MSAAVSITDRAVAQLKSGNKSQSRISLIEAIAAGEPSDNVWYLMACAADSSDERKTYLAKALEMNPFHEAARAALVTSSHLNQPQAAAEANSPKLLPGWRQLIVDASTIIVMVLLCVVIGYTIAQSAPPVENASYRQEQSLQSDLYK